MKKTLGIFLILLPFLLVFLLAILEYGFIIGLKIILFSILILIFIIACSYFGYNLLNGE